MRKICVVVTARPSYSRIRTALQALATMPDVELQVVVAASALLDRYGSAVDQIERDGFQIAARVYMVLEAENPVTMAKTTGIGLQELPTVFERLAPDVVVTIADRYETIATAIAASYMNIPVAHIQGGEITGSIDEKVRHAVTKLSNLHLVSTKLAKERVERMGEEPSSVHVTGCPSIDLAREVLESPGLGFDPFERYGGVGDSFDLDRGYLVVLQHPVTTEHLAARQQMWCSLKAVSRVGLPVFWFWPNVDAGSDAASNAIRTFREQHGASGFRFLKNIAPSDFLRLILHSKCLVGNSSVGVRESSFLGVPSVNVGTRQAGRERAANIIDVGHDETSILEAIERQVVRGRYESDHTYGDGYAGERIAEVLCQVPLQIEKRLRY